MFFIDEVVFAEVSDKLDALSNDAFSIDQNRLEIEGVANYVRVSCNNESDLDILFVTLDNGVKFSTYDYGIHYVRYENGKSICVLSINALKRSPFDLYLNVAEFNDCVDENEGYRMENGPEIVALLTGLLALT